MGRRRRRRRGAAGRGIAVVLVALLLGALLAQQALRDATTWASENTTAAVTGLLLVLATAGGLGILAVRRNLEIRRREEQRRQEEAARRVEQRRTLAWWDGLSPTDFEVEVARLLRRDGYLQVRHTGGRNDGGIDVAGKTPDGAGVAVQCKHFRPHGWIGVGDVRDFESGARVRGANLMLLVTTAANASPPARTHARQTGIRLILRDRLATWAAGTPLEQVLGGGRSSAAE